jgi:hypothetical protein
MVNSILDYDVVLECPIYSVVLLKWLKTKSISFHTSLKKHRLHDGAFLMHKRGIYFDRIENNILPYMS